MVLISHKPFNEKDASSSWQATIDGTIYRLLVGQRVVHWLLSFGPWKIFVLRPSQYKYQ